MRDPSVRIDFQPVAEVYLLIFRILEKFLKFTKKILQKLIQNHSSFHIKVHKASFFKTVYNTLFGFCLNSQTRYFTVKFTR